MSWCNLRALLFLFYLFALFALICTFIFVFSSLFNVLHLGTLIAV